MSERIAAFGLFTLILALVLKALVFMIGFQNVVIVALAAIAVLAVDSRR